MEDAFTRVTLFVPGPPTMQAVCDGLETEWVENDGEIAKAFSFGTVDDDVLETLDAAPGALVIHVTSDLREGRAEVVALVERLRAAGGLAVRIEQSKLGWDIARWLDMFSSDSAWAWHRGAIAFLGGKRELQSCGMHAFSLPDVHIAIGEGDDAGAVQQLASVLDVYQLDEDPVLRSGETFAPDAETPRRRVERWPDTQYPSDHPCHNPYGVWRLGPPGGVSRPMGDLVPVFVPALRAILMALEGEAEASLTQEQVETTRDEGACIMMEPRDAQKLERSRGYADFDPELVWEQWKLVATR